MKTVLKTINTTTLRQTYRKKFRSANRVSTCKLREELTTQTVWVIKWMNLIAEKPRSFIFKILQHAATIVEQSHIDMHRYVHGFVMNQMTANEGNKNGLTIYQFSSHLTLIPRQLRKEREHSAPSISSKKKIWKTQRPLQCRLEEATHLIHQGTNGMANSLKGGTYLDSDD